MPKNQMTMWLARMFQNNRIKFPKKSNKHVDELKRQISIFSEVITESGSVSYRAEGHHYIERFSHHEHKFRINNKRLQDYP